VRRRFSMQVIFLGTNGWYDSPTGEHHLHHHQFR
jgi:hypothetical protein